MNFLARSCKKCLISKERTKTNRFAQNYATFSNKLPCFGLPMNFSAKGCKNWLNSWKSTKNLRFGQNFKTFRTNYHVCTLINFLGKSCKKSLISWKSTKNHRFGQNLQLLEQTTLSCHFHELFRKKLQKVLHFVEKHEKSSIWPTLCNFSNKLPCFCISMNF